MQVTKQLRYVLFALLFGALSIFNSVYAQSSDEDSSIKLSEQESTRLRAVIDLPVDPNSLKATRVQAYKQKHAAAWKLGDVVKQEEVLREWAQMDTDIDPR